MRLTHREVEVSIVAVSRLKLIVNTQEGVQYVTPTNTQTKVDAITSSSSNRDISILICLPIRSLPRSTKISTKQLSIRQDYL